MNTSFYKPPASQLERAEETCNKFTEGTEYKINSIVGNNNDKNYSFCPKHFLKASFFMGRREHCIGFNGLLSYIGHFKYKNFFKSD